MNLSEKPNIEVKSLTEQLGILKISERQISTESTQLYTLQIAAFAKPQSVHRFVMEHWIRSGAEKRLIYNSTRKRLALSVQGGDVVVKGDPLYEQYVRVGSRNFHRIRYGAYENIVDAKRDRLRIERTTGLYAQIVPCVLSASLIDQMWLQPVANRFIGSPFA